MLNLLEKYEFDTDVVSILKLQIIPKVKSVGSIQYVHQRLINARATAPLPPEYKNVLLHSTKCKNGIHMRNLSPYIHRKRNLPRSTCQRMLPSCHQIPNHPEFGIAPKNKTQFTPIEDYELFKRVGAFIKTKMISKWIQ